VPREAPQELEGTGWGKGHDTASAADLGCENAVGEASDVRDEKSPPRGSKFKAPHAYRAHQVSWVQPRRLKGWSHLLHETLLGVRSVLFLVES